MCVCARIHTNMQFFFYYWRFMQFLLWLKVYAVFAMIEGLCSQCMYLHVCHPRCIIIIMNRLTVCNIYWQLTPSWVMGSWSRGQMGLVWRTESMHSLQKRCPHSVCTGFCIANWQIGHSCLFKSWWTNIAWYPGILLHAPCSEKYLFICLVILSTM